MNGAGCRPDNDCARPCPKDKSLSTPHTAPREYRRITVRQILPHIRRGLACPPAMLDPRLAKFATTPFGSGNCECGAADPANLPFLCRGRTNFCLHPASSKSSGPRRIEELYKKIGGVMLSNVQTNAQQPARITGRHYRWVRCKPIPPTPHRSSGPDRAAATLRLRWMSR